MISNCQTFIKNNLQSLSSLLLKRLLKTRMKTADSKIGAWFGKLVHG
ncbi:hypothetical protein HMPREF0494_0731 [Limosilactobacillus antri DSM 16041]|uniref:Uncharacterized protein n=1 Tax=Limosilactobacillus antri DSM 16041 TaxID=525309 RepID=C8P5Y7_9LACO|nr:hypothetical protein HMPREF0494_0731 [Limosilactobacillus antri DSM 16041]